jgi:signal transduction histidine kinase
VPRAWASDRIGQAVTAVRRLVKLVEALLDVSRITAGRLDLEPEPMDFGQAVDAVVSRFADQLKERQIVSRVPRTPGSWDRLRVEQIVTNLLSNAIKFGEGLPIEISVESDEATVCLTVTDHGIGIDGEHQQQLFERFERAVSHRHYGGFGLELWITQQIVDAMGGRIAIESRPAEGSTFRVTLPLHSAALTAADQEGLPR